MGRIFVPTGETLPPAADAVVIGGGIVGVASAFWLARAGLETVLLETRGELSSLTSCQSIESFRAQFSEPAMAELALASIGMLDAFADVIGIPGYDIEVRHQGYLFVTDDPAQLPALQAAVAAHHSLGVPDSEYLDAAELHARFPYLSERAVGATFRQKDGWFSSHGPRRASPRAVTPASCSTPRPPPSCWTAVACAGSALPWAPSPRAWR